MTPESEKRARKLGLQIAHKVSAWLTKEGEQTWFVEACDWDPLRAEGWANNSDEWAVAANVATSCIQRRGFDVEELY